MKIQFLLITASAAAIISCNNNNESKEAKIDSANQTKNELKKEYLSQPLSVTGPPTESIERI